MRALVCRGVGRVGVEQDYPLPEPPAGWARVRVRCAGVCATDLELVQGYKGFTGVLGHEFCGVVDQAPGAAEWEGRRVVGEINIRCGACRACRRGDTTHCGARRVLGILGQDGAFADYVLLPVENLHAVPDGVADDVAVFVEPVAAALAIADRQHVRPSDRVYVLGDGKLGLLVAQVLRLTGCACTVFGRHPQKLALATGWGLETVLLASAGAAPAADDDPPADMVVDCTGRPEGLAAAAALLRPRGTLVLKSTFHGESQWDPTAFVVNEWTVAGSRCGPFAPALRLLRAGLIETKALVQHTYPLSQAAEALSQAGSRGALKILIHPG